MTETQELIQTILRGLAVISYSWLYARGGRNTTEIRRIGAPLAFIAFMLFVSPISWKTLSLLALSFPLWFGYGRKEIRRVIYAFISGAVGACVCAVYGNYWMALLQFCITFSSTIFLGLINPVSAVREEFLIALLSVAVIAFTI